jgi:hypothetical protein
MMARPRAAGPWELIGEHGMRLVRLVLNGV